MHITGPKKAHLEVVCLVLVRDVALEHHGHPLPLAHLELLQLREHTREHIGKFAADEACIISGPKTIQVLMVLCGEMAWQPKRLCL